MIQRQLPNYAFTQLVGSSATVNNVLLYGLLELVSFAVVNRVMKRKFNISTVYQLAFVLETQWKMVQSKLVLWVLLVLQFSLLLHHSADQDGVWCGCT